MGCENHIRAVVLRGAGGHFCAGGDIRDMMTIRQQAVENPILIKTLIAPLVIY